MVIEVNHSFTAITGKSREQVIKKPFDLAMYPNRFLQEIGVVLQAQGVWQGDCGFSEHPLQAGGDGHRDSDRPRIRRQMHGAASGRQAGCAHGGDGQVLGHGPAMQGAR